VCADGDGDLRGPGCLLGVDCDDSNDDCYARCNLFLRDLDGDGYGDPATKSPFCSQPEGWVADTAVDCNDNDANVFPGQSWYADCDGDGYFKKPAIISCLMPQNSQWSCADSQAPDGGFIHTDPAERADCDDRKPQHWSDCAACRDEDGDGWGLACNLGADCDESRARVNPSQIEIDYNGLDDNCDGDFGRDLRVVGVVGGGQVHALEITLTHVFAGIGSSLVVLPANDITAIPLAQIEFPSTIMDLKLAGNALYVGVYGEGVFVLDVTDPSAPEKILERRYQTGDHYSPTASGIDIEGNRLFTCERLGANIGIRIFDLSDAYMPMVGQWASYGISTHSSDPRCDIIVANGQSQNFGPSSSVIFLYDEKGVTGGQSDESVRWPAIVKDGHTAVYHFSSYSGDSSITVDGDDVWNKSVFGALGLEDDLLFFSPKRWPTCLGVIDANGFGNDPDDVPCTPVTDAGYGGDILEIEAKNDAVYVAHGRGLTAFTASNAIDPPVKTHYRSTLGEAGFLASDGTHVYTAIGAEGMQVLALVPGSLPIFVSRYRTVNFPLEIIVDGTYAFVVGSGNLEIVDISNPATPSKVSVLSWDNSSSTARHDAAFLSVGDTDYLFVMAHGKINVLNVTNRAVPVRLGQISDDASKWAEGLAAIGNRLVVAKKGVVRFYSVPEIPGLPAFLSSTTSIESPGDAVPVGERYVVISNAYNSTMVFDALAGQLLWQGEWPALSGGQMLAVSGNKVYGIDANRRLNILTLTDPANPTWFSVSREGHLPTRFEVQARFERDSMMVVNGQLITAGDDHGISVFDLTSLP
jgi:hypothetical protein